MLTFTDPLFAIPLYPFVLGSTRGKLEVALFPFLFYPFVSQLITSTPK